jgi:hypothetical protein
LKIISTQAIKTHLQPVLLPVAALLLHPGAHKPILQNQQVVIISRLNQVDLFIVQPVTNAPQGK